MHTYNPLELTDTIAEIIQYLSEEDLEICSRINNTWYKEIERELYKRLKYPEGEYQKILLRLEENSSKWRFLGTIFLSNNPDKYHELYNKSEYLRVLRICFFRKNLKNKYLCLSRISYIRDIGNLFEEA